MPKTAQYPLITIITPSFNQGAFIKQTIDSVLNQKYPALQYIVMDGGSTDNTVKILKSYGKKITWFSKKDKGQTDAINKGLRLAKGDIIAYLNSDDVYLPNTLHTVAKFFMDHPQAMWVTGDYSIIDEHGKQIQTLVAKYKQWLRRWPVLSVLAVANFIIQPSTFWRSQLHTEVGLFDANLRYCMDFDFWLRVLRKYPLFVVPQRLSLFRIHGQSKGGAQFKKQFAEEHQIVMRQALPFYIKMLHWLHAQAIVWTYILIK